LKDTSPGGSLDRLATLVVEHALEQPLEAHLPPASVARSLHTGLEGWLASDSAEHELATAIERLHQAMAKDPRPLREALPQELVKALTEQAATRRYSPDRELVLSVLDRPPVRALVRGLLLNVLIDFSRKVSAPVTESRVARGLTGLAKLAAQQARSSSGTLGSVASSISDEIERQVERRARDFADSALSGVMQQIADALSQPGDSAEQSELRVALLDGVMALKVSQLGQELARADVPASAKSLRKSLSRWLASERSQAELEGWLTKAMQAEGKRPLREVLGKVGLLEPARTLGKEALRERLAPVVASEPFARWLEELMRPSGA
jgi:hypothetical protein